MEKYTKVSINIENFLANPIADLLTQWDRNEIILEVTDIPGNILACFFFLRRRFDDVLFSLRLSYDLKNFCEQYDLIRSMGDTYTSYGTFNNLTALYRLRYPLGLTEESKTNYLEYLKKYKKEVLEYLIKSDYVDDFYYFFADLLLSRFNIDNNIEMAQLIQKPELVAFLNEYKRTHVEMRNRRVALKKTTMIDLKSAHNIIAPFCSFLDTSWASGYHQNQFLDKLKKYRKKIINILVEGDHLDAFTSTADILLTRQNIDSTLELAIHSHRTELVAFLIEYKDKHFKKDEISIKLFDFKPQNPDSYREVRKKWHLSDVSLKELTLGRYIGDKVEVLVLPLRAGKKNICRVGVKSGIGLPAHEVVIPEGYKIIRERAYSHVKTLEKITLPESLSVIEQKAFLKCVNLETINFGSSIDRLKYETFSGCARLKQIQIPDSVKFIEEACFRGCFALEDVEFGAGLEEIGQNAFYKCRQLKRIKIPDNTKEIGEGCFNFCEKLDEVDLGKNLEIIGRYAFHKCGKIKKITLPASLKMIGQGAFESTQIDEFFIEAENQFFSVKDGILFNKDYTELIL